MPWTKGGTEGGCGTVCLGRRQHPSPPPPPAAPQYARCTAPPACRCCCKESRWSAPRAGSRAPAQAHAQRGVQPVGTLTPCVRIRAQGPSARAGVHAGVHARTQLAHMHARSNPTNPALHSPSPPNTPPAESASRSTRRSPQACRTAPAVRASSAGMKRCLVVTIRRAQSGPTPSPLLHRLPPTRPQPQHAWHARASTQPAARTCSTSAACVALWYLRTQDGGRGGTRQPWCIAFLYCRDPQPRQRS